MPVEDFIILKNFARSYGRIVTQTMSLEQTLMPSRNFFLCFHKSSLRITQLYALSRFINPQSRVSLRFSSTLQGRVAEAVRYSSSYADHSYGHQVAYPRPTEVPWRKELSNNVHLIGVVGTSVEIKHLQSGKVVASTRLAVRKSATETTWIALTFWDELAHVAFQHVEKGQQIYISGRLVSDTIESSEGKQQTYYKVVVQQLNFVERNSPLASNDRSSYPMMSERKYGKGTTSNSGSTEELWQAFFADPFEWWDNRKNKKNPRYPDFKHKDTGEALWVESRNNPAWVRSQLEVLDSRLETMYNKDRRMPVSPMFADDVMPF